MKQCFQVEECPSCHWNCNHITVNPMLLTCSNCQKPIKREEPEKSKKNGDSGCSLLRF